MAKQQNQITAEAAVQMIMAAAGATQQYRYRWPRREVPPRTRKKNEILHCGEDPRDGGGTSVEDKTRTEPKKRTQLERKVYPRKPTAISF